MQVRVRFSAQHPMKVFPYLRRKTVWRWRGAPMNGHEICLCMFKNIQINKKNGTRHQTFKKIKNSEWPLLRLSLVKITWCVCCYTERGLRYPSFLFIQFFTIFSWARVCWSDVFRTKRAPVTIRRATLIKKKIKFSSYIRKKEWSSC